MGEGVNGAVGVCVSGPCDREDAAQAPTSVDVCTRVSISRELGDACVVWGKVEGGSSIEEIRLHSR